MSSTVVHLVNLPATAVSWARQYGPPLYTIAKQQTRGLPASGIRVSFSLFLSVQAMILPLLPVLSPFAVTMAGGIGICAAAWDQGSIQHASTITVSFFSRVARGFRPWHHQHPTAARMSDASAKPRRHQASMAQEASRSAAAEEDARKPAAPSRQARHVRSQRREPQATAGSHDVHHPGSSSSRTMPEPDKPLGVPGAAAVPGAASTPGSIPPKSEQPTPVSAISFSFTRQPCVGSPEQVPRMPLFGLSLAQGDSPSSWLAAPAGGPAPGAANSSIPVSSAAAVASRNQATPAGHTAGVQACATAPASSVQAPSNTTSSTSDTHGSSVAAVVQTAQQQGAAQSSEAHGSRAGVLSDARASPHSGCAAGISSQSDSGGDSHTSPAPPTAAGISNCSSQSQSVGESGTSPVTGVDAAQDAWLATDAVRSPSPPGQQAGTPDLAGVCQKLSFSPSSSNDSGDSRPRTPGGTVAGASQQPVVPLSPLEVTSPEGPGVTWSFNPVFYSMSGRPVPAHDALSSPPAANDGSTAGANPLADPWGSGMSVASSAGEAASEEGSPVAAGTPPAPDATTGPSVSPTSVGATEGPAAVGRVSGRGSSTHAPSVGEPRSHQPLPASSVAASTAGAAEQPAPAAAWTAATICGSGTGGPDSSSSANPVQGMASHARRGAAMNLSGGEATGSSCAQGRGLTLGHWPPHPAAAMSAAAISSGGSGVGQAAGREPATCRPPPAHGVGYGSSGESEQHSSQQADVGVNRSSVQAGAAGATEATVGVGSAASLENDSASVRPMQSLAGMPSAPAPASVMAGSRAGLARAGLSIIIPNSNSASSSSSSSGAAPTPRAVVPTESAQPGMEVCSTTAASAPTRAAGGLPPKPAPAAVKASSFFGGSSSTSRFGNGQAVNDVCSRTGTPQPYAASQFNHGCVDPAALKQAVPSGLPGDTGVEGGTETGPPAGAAGSLSGSACRRKRVVPRRHLAGSHSATPGVLAAPGPQ
jgi:hypothetical protein